MKNGSILWPLILIAAGALWILVNLKIIPAANLWALFHLLPYFLIALGVGLILHSRWPAVGTLFTTLVVIGAVAVVFFAPRLGWAQIPPWGFDSGFGGGVKGSGEVVTTARELDDFTALSIDYPAEVVVHQGKSPSVKIEADDNLLPQLSTDVKNGTLHIYSIERDWTKRVNPSQSVKITITVTDIAEIEFTTAGSLAIEGLDTQSLDLSLNGAGEITLNEIHVDQLDCNLNGAGSIRASGTAKKVRVQIDGLGNFRGDELDTEEADVTINGAGDINLQVQTYLVAEINGAGSVGYYGTPDINQRVNGAGTIRQLGK